MKKARIYMDHMASTPLDPAVKEAMLEAMDHCGNPSSLHDEGLRAQASIDHARDQVARSIAAEPKAVIFTSGATESNNIAIQGAALGYKRQGKHLVTMSTEHKAVLEVYSKLEREGFEVSYLKPQSNGILNLDVLRDALRPDTILVSVMHVNNEIGVIQDIAAISKLVHQSGALLHVDAAQSLGKCAIDVGQMGVDLLSLSAHKAYGPQGVGALYVRPKPKVNLQPIYVGGGQERGLRPGTLVTHQVVGMGLACELAEQRRESECERLAGLHQTLWQGLSEALSGITLNGDEAQRVPHNLNISFADVDGESLLLSLQDLAVSSGSACNAATMEVSHVLTAIGVPRALAHSAIRFSMANTTTAAEVDQCVAMVVRAVQRLRAMAPL